VLPTFFRSPEPARDWLARIAGLRWARLGGFDLAVPAAIGIVIWTALPQLGRDFGGVPFGVAWIAATVTIVALLRLRPHTPVAAAAASGSARVSTLGLILVVGVVVSWLLYDILFWSQTIRFYDLDVYLGSAARWLDGGRPYMTAPVTAWPSSAGSDFFLYPPPLLPVFGVLSRLPRDPVVVGWIGLLLACAYKSFRVLGLSRTLSLALLAFPPVAIGIESGNVAAVTFLLFAAGVRAGGSLIVDGLFKVQTGLPALWLIRGRRWRGLVAGVAVLALFIVATLPLVGLDSWRAWWDGLGYRAASQASVPALYGYSYAGMLPGWFFIAMSVALVGLALLFRGRRGLAALGLASIFASPSLWPHGFVFALPALLTLESGTAVWLLLGAGAFGSNMWLLFYGGWLAVVVARRLPSTGLHPLAGTDGPWPNRHAPRPARRAAAPVVGVDAAAPPAG
jgi:hypothetical protein